jgi:hypothetical protein
MKGGWMNEIVERCLNTFGMMQGLTKDDLEEKRVELTDYIAKLNAEGEDDANRLAVSGLTYLRNGMKRPDVPRTRAPHR